MTQISALFAILAVLAVGNDIPLAAQDVALSRSTGHILLLESDRALEGDIEKIGEQYRIRRGNSEVWLPAEKVLRLCADWEEAYAFMQRRCNLSDPDERLRLVRWCQLNNLQSQALTEAKAALEMRPTHADSRQLVSLLTRSLASPPSFPIKTAAARSATAAAAPAALDISADAVALFATRVQPILMNTCVNCHSGGRGGDFQLTHTEYGGRAVTQTNLAAVVAQIKVDNPPLSPLLIKAVSRHGNGANAPLADRQAVPFKTLQGWIDYVLASNPQLRQREKEVVAESPHMAIEPGGVFAQDNVKARATTKAVSRPMARAGVSSELPIPPFGQASAASAMTAAKTPIFLNSLPAAGAQPPVDNLDPFDPALFNGQSRSAEKEPRTK
jgi:hypothetical protein